MQSDLYIAKVILFLYIYNGHSTQEEDIGNFLPPISCNIYLQNFCNIIIILKNSTINLCYRPSDTCLYIDIAHLFVSPAV